ncbi:MarR family winged helix-turn-helix transcriptional regulator [Sulfobacillus harzensis]|uniref:MarR family transcriptional regulator n=1 Tax=Sulfobacillus harzensis TaxID=2729629 RepID=A0A7Y0Q4I8_9FIRM|nr:MarR family transcriptional regulator [Sulfobacillus harzensis]NMP23299.1 MarR family transcriptional regulator [Sulfobacillus harzensis]
MPTDEERVALKAVVNLIRLSEPLIFDLWRSHELTIAQVQCLRILSHQPEQAGDLAKKLSMSSTSLTRILERLETRGLVERTVDTHDRRRIWVRLTETGQARVSSMTSWYNTPLFAAIRHLSDEERTRFVEVLEHYTDTVRQVECATDAKTTANQA